MASSVVIGFDLGHGEMALARQALLGQSEPEVIEVHGKRSQMTAIAEGRNLEGQPITLIGEDAVEAFDLSSPDATLLEIGFKGHPSRNLKAETYVPRFASAVYQYLLDREQIDAHTAPPFFIGYPAGWTAEERDDYERLLTRSRIPNLKVVPESRAALAHAKETGGLTLDQIRGPVLVIDIGSSTTDFTLQRSLEGETSSYGLDLGAALIDRALLERMLAEQKNSAELTTLLATYPSYRNRLELICRKAKEGYFDRLDSDLYRRSGQRPVHRLMEDIQQRLVFRVRVDGPLMDEILAQPLAELGGRSWTEALRAAALDVRRRWIETEGLNHGVVLATGGASRMDFIAPLCKEVFPGWTYVAGTEPDLAIARGLARWGRNYLRTQGFDAETHTFMRDELPGLVAEAAPQLAGQLAGPLADGLIEHVIQPGLNDWRHHRIATLQELESQLPQRTEAWLHSDDARTLVNRVISDWLRPILVQVHDRLSPICARYGVLGDPFAILSDIDPGSLVTSDFGQAASWGRLTTTVRDLVGGTSAAALGAVFFVAQGVFLRLGPTGWVTAAIVTGLALLIGKEVAEDYVKTMRIPYPLRGPLLSETRIREVCQQNRPAIVASLEEALAASNLSVMLTHNVEAKLAEALRARVMEIRLLIS